MNTMTRRTALTAAASVPVASLPVATATGDEVRSYDAIRERIATVVETYSRSLWAFPEPMPAEDAAAALALTDDEIEELGPVLAFAHKYGVCLDWLLAGDEGALLVDGRLLRHRERREREDVESDPAVIAYREWRRVYAETRPIIDRAAEMRHTDEGYEEADRAQSAAIDREIAACERLAEVEATTLEGIRCQLIALADANDGLRCGGDPENITDYGFYRHNYLGGVVEMKMRLAMYAGIARALGRDDADEAAAAIKRVVYIDKDAVS